MKSFCVGFILLPLFLCATEYAPWFDRVLEFEARGSAAYQAFNSVDSKGRSRSYKTRDLFSNLSLALAIPMASVELETLLARTHHRTFGFDNFKFTGRYLWMDDVVGDPASITSGLSLIFPYKRALHDVSSFHHGIFELESHVAVGKEYDCWDRWQFRHYGLFIAGIADRGSPWLALRYFAESRVLDRYSVQCFIRGLMGLGWRRLHPHHFQGYGAVGHRSIDGGIRLSYQFDFEGQLFVEYVRRFYARNFPKDVNWVQITYLYPFGI